MGRAKSKLLLVEGHDDLISVVELMSGHVEWPEDRHSAPVHITDCKGLGNLLDQDTIGAAIKTPGLVSLGIMLDADDSGHSRWNSVKDLLLQHFPDLPPVLPAEGLVFEGKNNIRVGVWIMPDNTNDGSLETFLSFLIPVGASDLWRHAQESVENARNFGMPCRGAHLGKAYLYTWLAWQDPPGQLSGRALTKKVLDPQNAMALPFIEWFIRLFEPVRLSEIQVPITNDPKLG